jgi:hypothetical protein
MKANEVASDPMDALATFHLDGTHRGAAPTGLAARGAGHAQPSLLGRPRWCAPAVRDLRMKSQELATAGPCSLARASADQ